MGDVSADLNIGTKPVDPAYSLDEARLAAWLSENIRDFRAPMTVRQFKGGQSNPTYQLVTPNRKYVLRRKPPGKLLPSAHAVDREFRAISRLGAAGFPVAQAYALCMDEAVIGTIFYVMEMVEGRILWDSTLADELPETRAKIYDAQILTLAKLHNIDPVAAGLDDFGKTGNYFRRQIDRWTRQYQASETQPVASMNRMMEWLPETIPEDDVTTVVHGDYRLDNLVFDATRPEVIAVLDWELSTLGNPLADFSYFLMSWVVPPFDGPALSVTDLKDTGIPSILDVVQRYCDLTGRSSLPQLEWYFAYNLFRLGAICQGIAGRVRDGTATSSYARSIEARVPVLGDLALFFAKKATGVSVYA